ncbi:hypothetical protein [Herbaspirillum sp.]|uniref:hypothetical protein n=1 Tax=Herbaspirillum sp. TaxID=1890675 RepID=UPI001B00C2A2|nr:hypothetical protein [Herbaspirillum sp.]MBO9538739.1 hypothetical protein [Herbaspirillum sp.]
MIREDVMQWSLLLGVANFLLTWGVALYMYLSNKNKATNARIDALEAKVTASIIDHGNRLTKLEGGPTHQDLGMIHEKINEVSTEVAMLNGTVTGMNRLLTSIDEHLRRRG